MSVIALDSESASVLNLRVLEKMDDIKTPLIMVVSLHVCCQYQPLVI
jgi:hypothetical protein